MKTKKGIMESSPKLKSKKKLEPPSFNFLWGEAVEALRMLTRMYPSEYWEHATKVRHVPLLFPRQKGKSEEYLKELTRKGVRWSKQGRRRDQNHPMNKEVGWAYGEVWEKRHLLNLPRQFNLKTYPEWEPWLVEAFMNNHDDSPEKSEDLKQLVEEQVNRNCSVKGKEIDGRKLSRSEHDEEIKKGREATPADYCAEIKKSFKKAAKRFANDMSWERGD